MKTKAVKRREAVERLEREPRIEGSPTPEFVAEIRAKRQAEAKRLREVFNIPK